MNDGILSQEEINALLSEGSKTSQDSVFQLTAFERDTLGEIGNISMGTAATILSTLLNRKVAITTPDVSVTTREQLQSDYPLPYVVVEVEYKEGLSGANIFIVKEPDACIIADLMMQKEPEGGHTRLNEMELSAVAEAMNQMMGSATTSLSTMFDTRIDISPPRLTVVNLGEEKLVVTSDFTEIVRINFKMEIEGLLKSEIMQIIPIEAVKSMMQMLIGSPRGDEEKKQKQKQDDTRDPFEDLLGDESFDISSIQPKAVAAKPLSHDEAVARDKSGFTVQPVQFSPLHQFEVTQMPQNIGLIMDVPLDVSVELGKSRRTIKDILELQQGSIIQLDKLAGEPVDLIVNGKLIARGEVVVIDENYGIRITAIVSPMDRVNKLQ